MGIRIEHKDNDKIDLFIRRVGDDKKVEIVEHKDVKVNETTFDIERLVEFIVMNDNLKDCYDFKRDLTTTIIDLFTQNSISYFGDAKFMQLFEEIAKIAKEEEEKKKVETLDD